jgi:hypothetical protein
MKNTTEAIDIAKNKMLKLTSVLNESTVDARAVIGKYIIPIITCICSIFLLGFYFTKIHNRDYKLRYNMIQYRSKADIYPLTSNSEVMNGNFKLCDFYIASSYKSFLPGSQYYDISSIDCILNKLECGSRYIELDIYQDSFCWESAPKVYVGKLQGLWNYTNKLDFEECIKKIREVAFGSSYIKNGNDPLFICLNIYTEQNYKLLSKIATIINDNFGNKLLSSSYSYKTTNLAQTPIKELIGKVVIISNDKWEGCDMEEIVNFSWEMPFLRNLSSEQILNNFDKTELREYNRRNITRVFPYIKGKESTNYNPAECWLTGSQFVCMNYQTMDEFMTFYLDKFSKYSLVLKPAQLRFIPPTYADPTPQNPVVSFAPLQHSTPFYSITY